MVLVLTPEECNAYAYHRLNALVDDIHLSFDTAFRIRAIRQLIEHIHQSEPEIVAALLALEGIVSPVEVANEQPISAVCSTSTGIARAPVCSPVERLKDQADVEPGENGTDAC